MTYSLFGMKARRVQELFNTFPALYRHFLFHDVSGSEAETAIACGHGRFRLVYDLSRAIEAAALKIGLNSSSSNWPMVVRVADVDGKLEFNVVDDINDLSICALCLAGAARPLLSPGFKRLIVEAEAKSSGICDSCGQPGFYRNSHTSCDWCASAREQLESDDDSHME